MLRKDWLNFSLAMTHSEMLFFLNDAGNSPANLLARPGEGRGLVVESAGERQVVPRDRRKPRIRSSSGKLRGSELEAQTSELDVVEAISTLQKRLILAFRICEFL